MWMSEPNTLCSYKFGQRSRQQPCFWVFALFTCFAPGKPFGQLRLEKLHFLRIPAYATTITYEIIGQGNILWPPRAKLSPNKLSRYWALATVSFVQQQGKLTHNHFCFPTGHIDNRIVTELESHSPLLCCCIKCKMSA